MFMAASTSSNGPLGACSIPEESDVTAGTILTFQALPRADDVAIRSRRAPIMPGDRNAQRISSLEIHDTRELTRRRSWRIRRSRNSKLSSTHPACAENSGSLAKMAAMRCASSRVSSSRLTGLIPVVGFTSSFYRRLHIRCAGRLY
jgi:hypothetical protein